MYAPLKAKLFRTLDGCCVGVESSRAERSLASTHLGSSRVPASPRKFAGSQPVSWLRLPRDVSFSSSSSRIRCTLETLRSFPSSLFSTICTLRTRSRSRLSLWLSAPDASGSLNFKTYFIFLTRARIFLSLLGRSQQEHLRDATRRRSTTNNAVCLARILYVHVFALLILF